MIKGKVAAIVDNISVIINVGKDNGVTPGMRFNAIYFTKEVADPDNPAIVLAPLSFVICEFVAENVYKNFSYCVVALETASATTPGDAPMPVRFRELIHPEDPQLAASKDFKVRIGTPVHEQKPKTERSIQSGGEKIP
jgi:hypothetical protein